MGKKTALADVPWKEVQKALSSLHKLPFVQAFIDYLNEVNESNWKSRIPELISAYGKTEEAGDRSLWFRDPAFYNSNGSSEISWETIRHHRDLIREPLRLAAFGFDSGASAFGLLLFFMMSAFADKRDLNATAFLRMVRESLQKPGEYQQNLLANTELGVLDSILFAMIFLLQLIHLNGKLGCCPECGKLFIRLEKYRKIWCSPSCRSRVYNRKGAKGKVFAEMERNLAVEGQNGS